MKIRFQCTGRKIFKIMQGSVVLDRIISEMKVTVNGVNSNKKIDLLGGYWQ